MNKETLLTAVEAALAGDWHKAHNIAQDYSDDAINNNIANWIHAVLHKIEGDEWNSKYWYARTNVSDKLGINDEPANNGGPGKKYEDFSDAREELIAIQSCLK